MLIAAALALTLVQDPQDPPAPPPVIQLDPQVQSWLDRSPARERGPIWDENRVHGEVSVGVGTGGWRSWGGRVDAPTRLGRFSLQYHQSEGGPVWGEPYGRAGDPYYSRRGLGADDQPMGWADRRPENGAAGQD